MYPANNLANNASTSSQAGGASTSTASGSFDLRERVTIAVPLEPILQDPFAPVRQLSLDEFHAAADQWDQWNEEDGITLPVDGEYKTDCPGDFKKNSDSRREREEVKKKGKHPKGSHSKGKHKKKQNAKSSEDTPSESNSATLRKQRRLQQTERLREVYRNTRGDLPHTALSGALLWTATQAGSMAQRIMEAKKMDAHVQPRVRCPKLIRSYAEMLCPKDAYRALLKEEKLEAVRAANYQQQYASGFGSSSGDKAGSSQLREEGSSVSSGSTSWSSSLGAVVQKGLGFLGLSARQPVLRALGLTTLMNAFQRAVALPIKGATPKPLEVLPATNYTIPRIPEIENDEKLEELLLTADLGQYLKDVQYVDRLMLLGASNLTSVEQATISRLVVDLLGSEKSQPNTEAMRSKRIIKVDQRSIHAFLSSPPEMLGVLQRAILETFKSQIEVDPKTGIIFYRGDVSVGAGLLTTAGSIDLSVEQKRELVSFFSGHQHQCIDLKAVKNVIDQVFKGISHQILTHVLEAVPQECDSKYIQQQKQRYQKAKSLIESMPSSVNATSTSSAAIPVTVQVAFKGIRYDRCQAALEGVAPQDREEIEKWYTGARTNSSEIQPKEISKSSLAVFISGLGSENAWSAEKIANITEAALKIIPSEVDKDNQPEHKKLKKVFDYLSSVLKSEEQVYLLQVCLPLSRRECDGLKILGAVADLRAQEADALGEISPQQIDMARLCDHLGLSALETRGVLGKLMDLDGIPSTSQQHKAIPNLSVGDYIRQQMMDSCGILEAAFPPLALAEMVSGVVEDIKELHAVGNLTSEQKHLIRKIHLQDLRRKVANMSTAGQFWFFFKDAFESGAIGAADDIQTAVDIDKGRMESSFSAQEIKGLKLGRDLWQGAMSFFPEIQLTEGLMNLVDLIFAQKSKNVCEYIRASIQIGMAASGMHGSGVEGKEIAAEDQTKIEGYAQRQLTGKLKEELQENIQESYWEGITQEEIRKEWEFTKQHPGAYPELEAALSKYKKSVAGLEEQLKEEDVHVICKRAGDGCEQPAAKRKKKQKGEAFQTVFTKGVDEILGGLSGTQRIRAEVQLRRLNELAQDHIERDGVGVSGEPELLYQLIENNGFEVTGGLKIKSIVVSEDGQVTTKYHTVTTVKVGGKEIVVDASAVKLIPGLDSSVVLMSKESWLTWVEKETRSVVFDSLEGIASADTDFENLGWKEQGGDAIGEELSRLNIQELERVAKDSMKLSIEAFPEAERLQMSGILKAIEAKAQQRCYEALSEAAASRTGLQQDLSAMSAAQGFSEGMSSSVQVEVTTPQGVKKVIHEAVTVWLGRHNIVVDPGFGSLLKPPKKLLAILPEKEWRALFANEEVDIAGLGALDIASLDLSSLLGDDLDVMASLEANLKALEEQLSEEDVNAGPDDSPEPIDYERTGFENLLTILEDRGKQLDNAVVRAFDLLGSKDPALSNVFYESLSELSGTYRSFSARLKEEIEAARSSGTSPQEMSKLRLLGKMTEYASGLIGSCQSSISFIKQMLALAQEDMPKSRAREEGGSSQLGKGDRRILSEEQKRKKANTGQKRYQKIQLAKQLLGATRSLLRTVRSTVDDAISFFRSLERSGGEMVSSSGVKSAVGFIRQVSRRMIDLAGELQASINRVLSSVEEQEAQEQKRDGPPRVGPRALTQEQREVLRSFINEPGNSDGSLRSYSKLPSDIHSMLTQEQFYQYCVRNRNNRPTHNAGIRALTEAQRITFDAYVSHATSAGKDSYAGLPEDIRYVITRNQFRKYYSVVNAERNKASGIRSLTESERKDFDQYMDSLSSAGRGEYEALADHLKQKISLAVFRTRFAYKNRVGRGEKSIAKLSASQRATLEECLQNGLSRYEELPGSLRALITERQWKRKVRQHQGSSSKAGGKRQ